MPICDRGERAVVVEDHEAPRGLEEHGQDVAHLKVHKIAAQTHELHLGAPAHLHARARAHGYGYERARGAGRVMRARTCTKSKSSDMWYAWSSSCRKPAAQRPTVCFLTYV